MEYPKKEYTKEEKEDNSLEEESETDSEIEKEDKIFALNWCD